MRKDLGAKPLASPTLASLAAATGTYALESRQADFWLLFDKGALPSISFDL